MSASPGIEQQVLTYYRLVDAQDLDRLLELFADDCVYDRPGYEPLRGKQALSDFYRDVRVIDSGRHELMAVITQGDSVAVEGRFRGKLRNGDSTDIRFADFFRFAGSRIVERHTYFHAPAV